MENVEKTTKEKMNTPYITCNTIRLIMKIIAFVVMKPLLATSGNWQDERRDCPSNVQWTKAKNLFKEQDIMIQHPQDNQKTHPTSRTNTISGLEKITCHTSPMNQHGLDRTILIIVQRIQELSSVVQKIGKNWNYFLIHFLD